MADLADRADWEATRAVVSAPFVQANMRPEETMEPPDCREATDWMALKVLLERMEYRNHRKKSV